MKHFFCFAFLALIATEPYAAPSLEDYGSLPSYSKVRLSPKGTRLALRSQDATKDVINVYDLIKKKNIAAIDIRSVSADDLYFFNEDQLVILASDEKYLPMYKEKILSISSAFLYDINSQEFKQLLTPGDVIYLGQTGLGNIAAVDKSKKFVYMPAYVGKSNVDHNPGYALLKVKLDRPRRPKVIERGKNQTISYMVDTSGNILAREDFDNRRNLHSILVKEKKNWRTIYEKKTSIRDFGIPGVTADYKSLVIINEDENTGHDAYFTMSLANGEIKSIPLSKPNNDIASVYIDINKVVFGIQYAGLTPSYEFFDSKLNARINSIVEKTAGISMRIIDSTDDWKKILIQFSGSNSPGDYYLVDETGEMQFIAAAYAKIKPEDVHPVGSTQFKARDQLTIPTILTIPKKYANNMKNLPAIILPHGGPESHDTVGFHWEAQAFANEGYLVIQPQFRGSDGFGTAHVLAGLGEWGKKMQDDLTDTVEYFTQKGMVDPNRVCIVGSSYGGYAALAGGAYTPNLYQCVVSINGVSDIFKMLKEQKAEHGKDHWAVAYWEKQFAKGNIKDADLKAISPINFAAQYQAPTLLIYSTKDKTVSANHSKRMFKALKKEGKVVEIVKLDGENHYMENRETRLASLRATVEFIHRHIGDKTK